MIEFFTVDVVTISSTRSRAEFNADLIEDLAEKILQTGGLVRPLVLKQTGIEAFEVVGGDLEFFAAQRAYELDPRKAEMVNAYVLKPANEAMVLAQLASLKAIAPSNPNTTAHTSSNTTTTATSSTSSAPGSDISSAWVSSVENRLAELRQLYQVVANETQTKFAKLEKQTQATEYGNLLDFINHATEVQLLQKLPLYFAKSNLAQAVIEARQKFAEQGFTSYSDLKEKTYKLGEKSILQAIDRWEQHHS